jgi:hypothetical protein
MVKIGQKVKSRRITFMAMSKMPYAVRHFSLEPALDGLGVCPPFGAFFSQLMLFRAD